MTGQSTVTITFSGAPNFAYSPACVKVSPGTQVTFSGAFASHPLHPGVDCVEDSSGSSPIAPTATGTSAQFSFDTAGSYGFYCGFHCGAPFNMKGAIFVQ